MVMMSQAITMGRIEKTKEERNKKRTEEMKEGWKSIDGACPLG